MPLCCNWRGLRNNELKEHPILRLKIEPTKTIHSMKQILAISFFLLIGAINLSATKSDRLEGKWQAYKVFEKGKVREVLSDDKKAPWIEFAADNVLWTGEGKKDKKRGEWWFDDDNKTIHLIIKTQEVQFKIIRLSKKKLVLQLKDHRKQAKMFLNKVP